MVPGSANRDKSNDHKTNQQPLQRSHTGGLDCAQPRTPSPTKSRLNFLEGFKNTLRTRSPIRNNSIPVSQSQLMRSLLVWFGVSITLSHVSIRILDDCSKGALLLPPLDACRYLLLSIALSSVGATISHTSVIKELCQLCERSCSTNATYARTDHYVSFQFV
jgi:hypothetical protein